MKLLELVYTCIITHTHVCMTLGNFRAVRDTVALFQWSSVVHPPRKCVSPLLIVFMDFECAHLLAICTYMQDQN